MARRRVESTTSMRRGGVFTRSRSEIFLHRTRSGRVRPDPTRRRQLLHQHSHLAPAPPSPSVEGSVHVSASIKDLRLRRIFSPASMSVEHSPDRKGEIEPYEDRMELQAEEAIGWKGSGDGFDDVFSGLDDLEDGLINNSPSDRLSFSEMEKASIDQAMKDISNEHMAALVTDFNESTDGGVAVDNVLRQLNGLADASIGSTPPDHLNATEMGKANFDQEMEDLPIEHSAVPMKKPSELNSVEAGKNLRRLHAVEVISTHNTPPDHQNDSAMEKPSMVIAKEDLPNDNCTPPMTELSGPPKNRLGLRTCSRSKLFQNPSSFSYRRMLPFLMDLAKDNSSAVQKLPCPCHSSPHKAQNLAKERPTLSNCDPLFEECISTRGLKGNVTEESRKSITLEELLTRESSENSKVAESLTGGSPSKLPCKFEVHNEMELMPDTLGGGELESNNAKSEISNEDPVLQPELLCMFSRSLPTISQTLSAEELAGTVQAFSCLPTKAEETCMMVPTLEIQQETSLVESLSGSIPSRERYALAPRKGILKRKTSGCKGICICLDCASFRIHADRAFEFSRKQMLEADEVILGLLKELAGLRNLVEKSTSGSDAMCALLQLNQELLKGACHRASRAEEVASNRLKQMFHDLNCHCRIPGPKVTFAESVEEK